LLLPVVEHSSVLIILSLPIRAVADVSPALLCKMVQEKVCVLSVMSRGADSCKRVDNDLDVASLCFGNDRLQAFVTTKHLVCLISRRARQWRGVIFSILSLASVTVLEWEVVSLQSSHHIEGRDALLGVGIDVLLDILESSSLKEKVLVLIELSINVVYLDFVEGVVPDASGVDYETALGKAD